LRQLHNGEIDILCAISMTPPQGARHCAEQEIVWVGGETMHLDPSRPIPLLSYGEGCTYHRAATQALRAAGMNWDDVLTAPSMHSLRRAASVGLGVMAITRRRALTAGLWIIDEPPLPKLPQLYSSVHVRKGGEQAVHEDLADELTALIHGLRPPLHIDDEEESAA
jgi:DNA-binding transcriptional LysR family regulator